MYSGDAKLAGQSYKLGKTCVLHLVITELGLFFVEWTVWSEGGRVGGWGIGVCVCVCVCVSVCAQAFTLDSVSCCSAGACCNFVPIPR